LKTPKGPTGAKKVNRMLKRLLLRKGGVKELSAARHMLRQADLSRKNRLQKCNESRRKARAWEGKAQKRPLGGGENLKNY